MTTDKKKNVNKNNLTDVEKTCWNSHESLWQRSSPLPQYCLPLVRRLALTGQSSLGFRMRLKICFPVHRAMGWWTDTNYYLEDCRSRDVLVSHAMAMSYLYDGRVRERDSDFIILAHQYWCHYLTSFGSVKEGVLQSQEVGTCATRKPPLIQLQLISTKMSEVSDFGAHFIWH